MYHDVSPYSMNDGFVRVRLFVLKKVGNDRVPPRGFRLCLNNHQGVVVFIGSSILYGILSCSPLCDVLNETLRYPSYLPPLLLYNIARVQGTKWCLVGNNMKQRSF